MSEIQTTPLSTLDDVRAYIATVARTLDPDSRYIFDLLALVNAAPDVAQLERTLVAACRALRHSGTEVFARMTLREKLYANLITPETALFRFTEGEMEALDREILPALLGRKAHALIVPCSHGEEAYTLAAYFLKVNLDFEIKAFDIQPALIASARSGRLTFGYPEEYLAAPGRVAQSVLDRIQFEVGDAFALPLTDQLFDVILSRNFIGYFKPAEALRIVRNLAEVTRPGGVLFLDSFCVNKFPDVPLELERLNFHRAGTRPVFFKKKI